MYRCLRCNDTREESCFDCFGSGRIACGCGGRASCPHCAGARLRDCPDCGGTGRQVCEVCQDAAMARRRRPREIHVSLQ
jgi:hypothetical protein